MPSGGARPGAGAKPGAPRQRPKSMNAQDRLRERIRAGLLLTRLDKIAQGKLTSSYDAPFLNVQVRASEVLLRKVLPDLTKAEVTGADDGPIEIITRAE